MWQHFDVSVRFKTEINFGRIPENRILVFQSTLQRSSSTLRGRRSPKGAREVYLYFMLASGFYRDILGIRGSTFSEAAI
jgi:hypothetical protein